jgi:ketosteroid isomerase-like protein
MTTKEVAAELVKLASKGKFREALDELYAPDILSVEAGAPEGMSRETKGIEGVIGKGEWWASNHDIHSIAVEGPLAAGSHFSVVYKLDATFKPQGRRFQMEEIGVYQVADGKIVREEYFYTM